MAAYQRPDVAALDEFETLLRHLGDELAGWRRRCLRAEAELAEYRGRGGAAPSGPDLLHARQRVVELETENQQLRHRVELAKERVRALAGRLAFLEQTTESAS